MFSGHRRIILYFLVSVDIYGNSEDARFIRRKNVTLLSTGAMSKRPGISSGALAAELPSCRCMPSRGFFHLFTYRDTSFRTGPNFSYVQTASKIMPRSRTEFRLRMYVMPRIGFNGHAARV